MYRATEYFIVLYFCVIALCVLNRKRASNDLVESVILALIHMVTWVGLVIVLIWAIIPIKPATDLRVLFLVPVIIGSVSMYLIRIALNRSEARMLARERSRQRRMRGGGNI